MMDLGRSSVSGTPEPGPEDFAGLLVATLSSLHPGATLTDNAAA